MAVYKVPQDVEADDKLIGPFSFRQFIYLIVVALAIGLAWGLGQVFIPLAIIPLPIIILFGALALPLRKDQPMEIYLSAIVAFYLKPRRRLWDPDGVDSLIEITAPKTLDFQRTKDLSQGEAERRFSYLAQIVDTQGWAVRGIGIQTPNNAINNDVYFEAQQAQDIMDSNNAMAQFFKQKLTISDTTRHQEAIDLMNGQPSVSAYKIPAPRSNNNPNTTTNKQIKYNPYPEDMQQAIIQPLDPTKPAVKPKPTTSGKVISADIINLASNSDLSIETIAREANRINKRLGSGEEVIISLR
ncbi:MAG: PrgI family protein [Candidatus Saccharibacteria bacterium]